MAPEPGDRRLPHPTQPPRPGGPRFFTISATLAGAGIDVRTIAGRLGHANPAITLKTYAHFPEGDDRKAAEVIGQVALRRAETD